MQVAPPNTRDLTQTQKVHDFFSCYDLQSSK